MDNKTDQL